MIFFIRPDLKLPTEKGVLLCVHFVPIRLHVNIYRVLFLTVPPDFQYQNEKQVAANQDYFFKKFSM